MKNKKHSPLRGRRGETMAEVLVAMLVVALAVMLLVSMVTTSGKVNVTARDKDAQFYDALSKVEKQDSTAQKTPAAAGEYKVEIEEDGGATTEIPVDVY